MGLRYTPHWLLCFLFILIGNDALAVGGIRGLITNAKNELLPFASIVVRNTTLGTMSNADARYELALSPGKYEIVFQYLGYQTQIRPVEVWESYVQLDVVLQEQTVTLQELKVQASKEDPAYTIMRKAIAKSRFHTLQVQSYTARVYTRGGGRLTDSPFFLRNKLKKEGIDPNTVYFTESVADISFQQPHTFRQKVLSIRSNMEKFASPNDYLQASFYNPLVGGAVSPLSPKAFAYYRFQYLGIFKDRGFEVSKIKVTPRSQGDNVFEGIIYIIEDQWSIHSLELNTLKSGFRFHIKQLSAPVGQVWMPVSNQIEVKGSFLGFAGEFKYMASVSNYDLKLNPAFTEEVKLIDEKVEKPAPTAQQDNKKGKTTETLEEALAQKKELSRKDLNKLIREQEKRDLKEQRKKTEEPRVAYNDSTVIDSLAYRRDAAFWNEVRTVPLTRLEMESFQRRDSVMQREEAKATRDTLKKNTSRFEWGHLLGGHTYRFGKNTQLEYRSPLFSLQFNTIEGWAFHTSLRLSHTLKEKHSVFVRPLMRYSFAREKVTGTLRMGYRGENASFYAEGGQYVSQYNPENPIHPLVNTLWTLLFEQNYMKLYEKKFVALNYQRKLADGLRMRAHLEWADRYELSNNTGYTLIRYHDREYTPNAPVNAEQQIDQALIQHPTALTLNFNLSYQPWLRYSIRNGRKRVINDDSPLLGFQYRKGVASLLGSQVDYDLAELSFRHGFNVGIRGRLYYGATAGAFLNNRALSFPDLRHFAGNQTVLQTGDILNSFRLLDYYHFSTSRNYWHAHALYQFRRFLITQIPLVRMTGLKEAFFAHYLHTGQSQHYWEAGYTLNGILRIFRLEAVASFQGKQYQSFGIRIGLVLNGLKISERED